MSRMRKSNGSGGQPEGGRNDEAPAGLPGGAPVHDLGDGGGGGAEGSESGVDGRAVGGANPAESGLRGGGGLQECRGGGERMSADTNRPKMSAPTPETDRIALLLENLDEWIDDSLRKSKPIGLTLCAARSTIADHRARITELWDALETLRRERDEAREALDRIARPVWWMEEDQKRKTGSINGISGGMALALSEDAEYLKGIAKSALKGKTK